MKKMFLFFPFDSNFIVHGPLGLAEGGGRGELEFITRASRRGAYRRGRFIGEVFVLGQMFA